MMNHRIPQYFTSVPDDNVPCQRDTAHISKPSRPSPHQHHSREVVQDRSCQWSRAATDSPSAAPLQLSHRRFQATLADVAWSESEGTVVAASFGSPAALPAPPDWLNQPSASTHYPSASRHHFSHESSTSSGKRKHQHAHTSPRQGKLMRVHCQQQLDTTHDQAEPTRRIASLMYPSDRDPTTPFPDVISLSRNEVPQIGDHPVATTAHLAVGGSRDGLSHPASSMGAERSDGAALRVGVSQMSTKMSLHTSAASVSCVSHQSGHSHPKPKERNHLSTTSSRVLSSGSEVMCDLQDRDMAFAESNPRKTLSHFENKLIHRHRQYPLSKQFQMSQNDLLLHTPDPVSPYNPIRGTHSSLECTERFAQGCRTDFSNVSVHFPLSMDSKTPLINAEPHEGIDRSFSDYHTLRDCCHSTSCSSSTSVKPLNTFEKLSSHLTNPISHNKPYTNSFMVSSPRESSELSRHVVAVFDLTSRNSLSWASNHSKMYPTFPTQSEIARSLHTFSQKYIPESSCAEAFNTPWHADKIHQPPSTYSIPAQISSKHHSTNIHSSPSSNPCNFASGELQGDANIPIISKEVLGLPCTSFNSQPINRRDNTVASQNIEQEKICKSYNSLSGTVNELRNPGIMVSTCSQTTTSPPVTLPPNPGTSSITIINNEGKDNVSKRNEPHRKGNHSELVISTHKEKGPGHSSQWLSPGSHAETEPHDVPTNLHQGPSSEISSEVSDKGLIPQPNVSLHQLPHTSSKSKLCKSGTRRRRRHAVGLICGVCGDSARSLHFGGVSCDSCKAFFRRAVIARAYPSFLCVTTGLPPKIKSQKSEKIGNESSEPQGTSEGRLTSFIEDSNQPDSSPIQLHRPAPLVTNSGKVQKTVNSAFRSTSADDRLRNNRGDASSHIEFITPGTSTAYSEDENTHSSACWNAEPHSHSETPHQRLMQKTNLGEKCSGVHDSVSKESLPISNSNDAQNRLSPKKLVKCPPITITTRKYCQACRFQRCINIGMEIGWVTLENDGKKNLSNQKEKSNSWERERSECRTTSGNSEDLKNEDFGGDCDKGNNLDKSTDVNNYLTKDEQKQIEDLVDIYRSVFWGVPEPSYYRPALIDFPPPFALSESNIQPDESKYEAKQQTLSGFHTMARKPTETETKGERDIPTEPMAPSIEMPDSVLHLSFKIDDPGNEVLLHSSDSSYSREADNNDGSVRDNGLQIPKSRLGGHYLNAEDGEAKPIDTADVYFGLPYGRDEKEKNPEPGISIDEEINLPKDPQGINMFRKPLMRRSRPWLIRQLMGYTLRFLNVVLKLLKSVGRSLSATDRNILIRQGMTGLTFLNSVFTYDTDAEGWPERVFPPLPLVLQDEDSCGASDQPEYLQGVTMHSDEVATVVASDVLEHQLTFIRGMKVLVGDDCTCMFLLMAIMLFDSTQEGLEQPHTVEKIQENYCHLLKQYVGWKYRNGSPPNPGLERPYNFTTLSSLPLNMCTQEHSVSNVEQGKNLGAENVTMLGESDTFLNVKDLSATAKKNVKENLCDDRNIFRFKRPEGMYYSPPYPPSPVNPSSIFPFLMSRLADLKQVAHGYSSTPFLLQGSEVDEIAKLVARINVFMSDIIATEPERDFKNEGGDGGGEGGSGGNQDSKTGDLELGALKSGKDGHSGKDIDGKNSQQAFDSETQQQDKGALNHEAGGYCIPEYEFDWDSNSSEDDSDSICSQNAMSIGSSFDDTVGIFEADEDKKLKNDIGSGPKEEFQPHEIWEKNDSIPNFQGLEGYLAGICQENAPADLKVLVNKLDVDKSVYNRACNSAFEKYNVHPVEISQDELFAERSELVSNNQHMKVTSNGEDNTVSLENFLDNHSFVEEVDAWHKPNYNAEVPSKVQATVNENKTMDTEGNSLLFERADVVQPTQFIPFTDKPSELGDYNQTERASNFNDFKMQNKYFQHPHSAYELMHHHGSVDSRQGAQSSSLWDRIKATGKALLGLDSSRPRHQGVFWKGGSNVDEHTILQEGDGDLENWLNPLERPDSNSSGYVSTVSSPPPLLNIQREFDAYDSGGDWEDLFQKL